MAQVMYEICYPSYYQQYKNCYKFCITRTKPNLSHYKNYALCEHKHLSSEFCPITSPHFHVLVDVDSTPPSFKKHKLLSVPCLYSTYLHLFAEFNSLQTFGDILQKLVLAVEFNKNSELETCYTSPVHERLPALNLLLTSTTQSMAEQFISKPTRPLCDTGQKSIQNTKEKCASTLTPKTTTKATTITATADSCATQTDNLTKETLERFERILNGPHAAILCKFMDIVTSGYGRIDIDSELVFVKLTFEEKIKF